MMKGSARPYVWFENTATSVMPKVAVSDREMRHLTSSDLIRVTMVYVENHLSALSGKAYICHCYCD